MLKKYTGRFLVFGLVSLFLWIFFAGCFKDIPTRIIVYNNAFNDTFNANVRISGPLGVSDTIRTTFFNGSRVLGRFNGNLVEIGSGHLPMHNAVRLQFDLYIHDKWDGDHLRPGFTIPDVWKMQIDGYTLYQTTFSNTPGYTQAFPNDYDPNKSINPAHTDAWDLLPGVCSLAGSSDGTAHYIIDRITSHIADSITLQVSDATQPFNQPCLKSWSIDNVRITTIQYK